MDETTASELKQKLDNGESIQLIDVRQPDEYDFAKIKGAKLIPLGDIIRRMDEIDDSKETVIHCKAGGRSAKAIEFLQKAGFKGKLSNLKGGITVPKY
jgi:adenylyltransferase/sulfurtransferase